VNRIVQPGAGIRLPPMCRSIKTLRTNEEPASDEEIEAAALQFVRKISGYRKPSRANQEAFDRAVGEVADVTRNLLDGLVAPRQKQGAHN
jgi:hypothetical protein